MGENRERQRQSRGDFAEIVQCRHRGGLCRGRLEGGGHRTEAEITTENMIP